MQQNVENNDDVKNILLLIAGAFTFSYCFGIAVHELGHALAYLYEGISVDVFVINPFGRSYVESVNENLAGGLLQGSSGSLFNIFCASLVSAVLWKKKNLYFFPLLMWAGTAYIQESFAVTLDLLDGGPTADWAVVVAGGIPTYVVLAFAAIFMLIGLSIFLRTLAIAGVGPNFSAMKIVSICLVAITPFFILSLVYVSIFLASEPRDWVLNKSIGLGASIVLAVIFSLLFKPLYPFLEKVLPVQKQIIQLKHVGTSILMALSFITFTVFFYN